MYKKSVFKPRHVTTRVNTHIVMLAIFAITLCY